MKVIPSPQIPEPQHAFAVAQNCGIGALKASDQRVIVMSGTNAQRVGAARPERGRSGLAKQAAAAGAGAPDMTKA
ncbi:MULTISPECIES: hypothetical protein [Bradyrhizobium]|uniref:hypothetical protein n=1 Tax=Bradyrhizobium TaxID=374 RepID=UPI0012FE0A57|nr:hypothetical protein [Bradyrhizobium elkanii]WLA81807.1 hypothetical protein QNJ99_41730 [Bradyrhizobium elkanii]